MRYYFIYRTRNNAGEITSMGFSRDYEWKDEMYENMEFQRLCGFEVLPKVRDLG